MKHAPASSEASTSRRKSPMPPPERPPPSQDRRERAKSPILDAIAGRARALSPVSYLLKPKVRVHNDVFPEDEEMDDSQHMGFQSFAAALSPGRGGRQQQQNMSFLSATTATGGGADSSQSFGASAEESYRFEEEERLMQEIEEKRRAQLEKGKAVAYAPAASSAGNGWLSALPGFARPTASKATLEAGGITKAGAPSATSGSSPSQANVPSTDDAATYEPSPEDRHDEEDAHTSSSLSSEDSDAYDLGASDSKVTKSTARRKSRISHDNQAFKYRPGESGSSGSESDGDGGRRRRPKRKSLSGQRLGAEGMAPVMEGKKRKGKKGARGKKGAANQSGDDIDDNYDGDDIVVAPPTAEEEVYEENEKIPYDDSVTVDLSAAPDTAEDESYVVDVQRRAGQAEKKVASKGKKRVAATALSSLPPHSKPEGTGLAGLATNAIKSLLRSLIFVFLLAYHSIAGALGSVQRSLSNAKWSGLFWAIAAALLLRQAALWFDQPQPLDGVESSTSWMPSISFGRSDALPTYKSPQLPPDSMDELVERLSSLDRVVGSIRSDMEALTDRVKDVHTRGDSDRQIIANLTDGAGLVLHELQNLSDRVLQAEQAAKAAAQSKLIAQIATEAIESYLPAKLVVKMNPKTGALDVDPAFWRAMKNVFVDKAHVGDLVAKEVATLAPALESSPSAGATRVPSWREFIASNEDALRAWNEDELGRKEDTGAVVSRKTFLDLLHRELNQLKLDFETKVDTEVRQLGEEMVTRAAATSKAGSGRQASLLTSDELSTRVQAMIDAALLRYSKDVLAMTDYALFSAGGRVIPSITTDTYERRLTGWRSWVGQKTISGRPPATALTPDISVGTCWPFVGSQGQLGIRLARPIVVTNVTIEHAARDVTFDLAAAPRQIEGLFLHFSRTFESRSLIPPPLFSRHLVWAIVENARDREVVAEYLKSQPAETAPLTEAVTSLAPSSEHVLLGSFVYDLDRPEHMQTFSVPEAFAALGVETGIVVVRVRSNYGDGYTCLYRVKIFHVCSLIWRAVLTLALPLLQVRVHGHPASHSSSADSA